MRWHVDHQGVVPPFEQLKEQVRAAVEAGALHPGDRLPTVRAMAAEVGLAVNTVARTYRELEAEGVVDTRGRSGTFVSGHGVDSEARAAAAVYVARVRQLGLDDDQVLDLVRRAL